MLAVLCALGSALLYALASVLQHRRAVDQPAEQSMRLGLLVGLARQPGWLVGLVCDGGGFVLQFLALGHGPIVVVQPLLVCGLLFALPIGAAWSGQQLTVADWVAAVMVCVGLAVFLTVADPASGRDNTGVASWTLLLLSVTIVAGVLTGLAGRGDAKRRAALLAAAAGIVYGAAAALTKTASHLLGRGPLHLVTHWQLYVLIVAGAAGMLLAQSAFQAGALDFSLPAMTVVDPLASIAIGALVFREAIANHPLALFVEAIALVVMMVGVWILARSEAKVTGTTTVA